MIYHFIHQASSSNGRMTSMPSPKLRQAPWSRLGTFLQPSQDVTAWEPPRNSQGFGHHKTKQVKLSWFWFALQPWKLIWNWTNMTNCNLQQKTSSTRSTPCSLSAEYQWHTSLQSSLLFSWGRRQFSKFAMALRTKHLRSSQHMQHIHGRIYQWEFQDPKMEVLYHISGHILLGISPEI